jgi:hypothetical protein
MQWRHVFFFILRTSGEYSDDRITGCHASLLQLRMVDGERDTSMDQFEERERKSSAFSQVLSGREKRGGKKGARRGTRQNKPTSSRAIRQCMKKEAKKCKDLVKKKNEQRACKKAASSKCKGQRDEIHPQVTLQTPSTQGCATEFVFESKAKSLCLKDAEDLPEAWRPSKKQEARYGGRPWTAAEQKLANQSVLKALDEMIDYETKNPQTIKKLGMDSVESLIDFAFDASNMPRMRDRAVAAAVDRLFVIAEEYLTDGKGKCWDAYSLLSMLIYAHNLREREVDGKNLDAMNEKLTLRTNQAIQDCGSFSALLGYDPEVYFSLARMGNGKMYDMVMWVVLFLDGLRFPHLELPAETKPFITRVWRTLASYPKPNAKSFKRGANDLLFFDLAYLMTHAGYVPTGYGRHELCLSDGPWLYQFLRANFYAVLEMGELDLISEFIDLFRQYGCTEDSDRMVRDGARYLLEIYEKAGRSWIDHREDYEGKKLKPYDLIHKPWTAGAGVRRRIIEPIGPNTYGHIARQLLRE